MFNTIVGAGAVGAGAASRYGTGSGTGSGQKMRLLAAPAPQHCNSYIKYLCAVYLIINTVVLHLGFIHQL
jgi:hypothetical protein